MTGFTAPLSQLLAGIGDAGNARALSVSGLSMDSRRVRPGEAFVALKGATTHGITFAPAALARGASVVLAEAPAPAAPAALDGATDKVIWIENLRTQVGEIAARFYGWPSQDLRVIGVTGTNGKTSIVQLIAGAIEHLGTRAATVGTLGAGMVGAIEAGERTTPDAITLQALLAQFRTQGATHVAMEVSSHALEQGRVNAITFSVAVFTNLTRDHLDYHGTMDAYGAAKEKLFAWPGLHTAVVNIDDAFGLSLAARLPANVQRLRYAVEGEAEVCAHAVRCNADGIAFDLSTPWGNGAIESVLLGRFNVYNLLAVAGVLGALGYTFAQISEALAHSQPVPGRMQRVAGGSAEAPLVVVDYAHTPDALEQALTSLRAHCSGKLICVFGAGGERDQGKRPQMGAITERLADRIIVTDDNPRGEDGDHIVRQILAGLQTPERALVRRDRAKAIGEALHTAHRGDVVLVAGKGHEPYQEVGGAKIPFDDAEVARRILEARPC